MRQLAAAIRKALLNRSDQAQARIDTQNWFRALRCVRSVMGDATYYEGEKLTAEMLNTYPRSQAYIAQEKLAGPYLYKRLTENVCDN